MPTGRGKMMDRDQETDDMVQQAKTLLDSVAKGGEV